jgi:ATP-binding cassette subfamily B protein
MGFPDFESRQGDGRLSRLVWLYRRWIVTLVLLMLIGNGLQLVIPRLIAWSIDSYTAGDWRPTLTTMWFGAVAAGIFAFACIQLTMQTYAAEFVARDLRNLLAAKISGWDWAFVQQVGTARLLTNLTSDIDAIKTFIAYTVASIVSSTFLSVGAGASMFSIDPELALWVLLVVLVIGAAIFLVFRHSKSLAARSRTSIDWLNGVINESIVGASLVRVLDSHRAEREKFLAANSEALRIGLALNSLFSGLIPAITFGANVATLVILVLGGHFTIAGRMSLGEFAAFNSYVATLIFPMLAIGMMSNLIGQASAAYQRIAAVLTAPARTQNGTVVTRLRGDVTVSQLTLLHGQRKVLDNVSFHAPAATRTAILGPTAAGKTQLLYALAGLVRPQSGEILLDGTHIERYQADALHSQVGFVFQDSVMFNLTIRENIAFYRNIDDARMKKVLETAELADFIAALPDGLETVISERGASLSGGQKQRVMLARALAVEPQVLLLDDFTARVDARTEQRVLANVRRNYPAITLISVTQRTAPVEHYEQVLLLVEGRVLARGSHAELVRRSPEYLQIYNSQQGIGEP